MRKNLKLQSINRFTETCLSNIGAVLLTSCSVILHADVYFKNKRAFILPHKTLNYITLQTKNEEKCNVTYLVKKTFLNSWLSKSRKL